ncbi:hypothetical protein Clacol_010437 [Clathrus columnatus]|uniref:Peptidase S53 domain-containing protein n=1 Tax=Clathrus columnatus TaxID=1419009 RepID=A0AAV5ANA3_9AGAM|nr:hypothetical protein Clacol_010437 [Clathrus columnatus]
MPTIRNLVRLSFISSFGLASLLIFVLISSSPVQERLLVHDEIHTLPQEFQINGDADPQHILTLTIELVSNNMTGLEKELYAVSDPKSERYGQHLNRSQVDSFVRPSAQASTTLNKWLADQGITTTSKSSAENLIKIQVPVEKANVILNTTFQSVTHIPSNRSMVRAMTYSLPERLAHHTQGIYPITNLPKPSVASPLVKRRAVNATFRRGVDAGCDQAITPVCIQDLYNIPGDTPDQGATGGIGIIAFDGANIKGSDTANIDTQVVLGIAPHNPVTIYAHPANSEGLTDLLDAVGFLSGQSNIPQVIVLNYGTAIPFIIVITNSSPPVFPESTDGSDQGVQNAICNAIMQMGTQGISVVVSSGNGGVIGIATPFDPCFNSTSFLPTFPSTCPYVTSVGATLLSSGTEIGSPNSASGFSNIFSQAPYQADAVNGYLKQIGSLYNGRFNASGRGYPDIAAISGHVWTVSDGDENIVYTTLSSAPTVAAIIADLNTQRQSQGKSPLGFLNPLFYSNPHVLTDITQGNNPGCGTDGFPAKKGWDAITGLGSPNYTTLQQIV